MHHLLFLAIKIVYFLFVFCLFYKNKVYLASEIHLILIVPVGNNSYFIRP